DGISFHTHVEAAATPIFIDPADLPRIFAQESRRLFRPPILKNSTLKIYGQPDAIDTAQGALFPVEIKSHKDVQRSDELELAFYWRLLEPYARWWTQGVPCVHTKRPCGGFHDNLSFLAASTFQ